MRGPYSYLISRVHQRALAVARNQQHNRVSAVIDVLADESGSIRAGCPPSGDVIRFDVGESGRIGAPFDARDAADIAFPSLFGCPVCAIQLGDTDANTMIVRALDAAIHTTTPTAEISHSHCADPGTTIRRRLGIPTISI
jgi:hypothetical protein